MPTHSQIPLVPNIKYSRIIDSKSNAGDVNLIGLQRDELLSKSFSNLVCLEGFLLSILKSSTYGKSPWIPEPGPVGYPSSNVQLQLQPPSQLVASESSQVESLQANVFQASIPSQSSSATDPTRKFSSDLCQANRCQATDP